MLISSFWKDFLHLAPGRSLLLHFLSHWSILVSILCCLVFIFPTSKHWDAAELSPWLLLSSHFSLGDPTSFRGFEVSSVVNNSHIPTPLHDLPTELQSIYSTAHLAFPTGITHIICKNLSYSHPICSPYSLQHLNKWWLHSSSCSDQTSRRYPWLRALCAIFWLCIQSQKDPTTLNTATHHPGWHLSPGFLPCPLIGFLCFHFCLPTHGCQSNPIKTEGRYHNHSSALYRAVVSNLLQNKNQSPFHGLWGPTKSCTQLSLISLHIHSFHSIHTDLLLPLISQKSSALGPLLLPLSRMLSLASMSIQIGQLLYFHLRPIPSPTWSSLTTIFTITSSSPSPCLIFLS